MQRPGMRGAERMPRSEDATVALIGIDVGTTNVKLLAATPAGHVLHVFTRPMVVHRPQPGWADFDLVALEAALLDGLASIAAALPSGTSVAAIAVDSIGESFVGVDAEGAVVTGCPTWFDRRTSNALEEVGIDLERWYDITGMPDDDIATFHRLHWLRRHGQIDDAPVRRWLNVADYCVFRLCGEAVASPSLAARSGFFDRATGRWSDELLAAAGLDAEQLPRPLPAASVAGGLLGSVARRTGLTAGTAVVNAGHDHPCAGVACRVMLPGTLMDSTGTAEAVKTVVTGPLDYHATLEGRYDCYPHAVPGRFLLSGHLPSAGGFIAWLQRALTGDTDHVSAASTDDLLAEALESPPGANGARVLPFLEGTGAPFNRHEQTGEVLGLRGFHRRSDLLRAAFEGCSFWLALNVDTFERIVGDRIEQVVAVGGGSRSDLWLTIKSALLQRPIDVPDVPEAAAFGAALVAGMAVGAVGTSVDDLPHVPARRVAADAATRSAYQVVAREYRDLYDERFGAL